MNPTQLRTLAISLAVVLFVASNVVQADSFNVYANMSPAVCPAGGTATLQGSGNADDAGFVTGQANIQLSSPTNNLQDCTGLLGAGLILDGTVFFGFSGNLANGFNAWSCSGNWNINIARRGATGGLVAAAQPVFGNFSYDCATFFGIIRLNVGTIQVF